MVPDRLELQPQFVMNNNVDIVGRQILEFDESNNSFGRLVPTDIYSINKLRSWRNPINRVTVMYKTILIKKFKYRNIRGYEDYDLWLRSLNNPDIVLMNMPNTLVNVRARSQMYTRRVGFDYSLGELRFRFATSKYSKSFTRRRQRVYRGH